MLPPAVVEQQVKLGVSAEESKARRLQRQQARFRDRGGVFVPSGSNPLVDILLARTVSGESPSKANPRDVVAKRLSPAKARQTSPTKKAGAATATKESRAVAESSKSKPLASRKRKAKVVEPEADTATKPPPKRRGRPAKANKKAADPDFDMEHVPASNANTKSKSTSKGKGKQRNAAPSTSDRSPKTKTKPQAKAKSKVTKKVVEVLVSDDDETLVDAPHKAKSNSKRKTRHEDDGRTDDDGPVVRKRVIPHVDDSKASGSKTVKIERVASTGGSRKRTLEDGEERSQDGKYSKTNGKKRVVLRDDEDDADVAASPVKKGKVANSTSAKFTKDNPLEPASAPRPTKDVKSGEDPKATGKGKGKGRAGPHQYVVEPVEEDDDKRPPERVSKLKKRKKEEDNYDDRPRKVVKFSESDPPYSSQKLKENQSDGGHKSAAKSSVKGEPNNAPRLEPGTKPPSRAKTLKGPPREVLERIKASAVQHLRCADNEPDELDCLS